MSRAADDFLGDLEAVADPIERMSRAYHTALELQRITRDAVAQAREQDESWATIGEAIGITKQAAHQRHHSPGPRHSERAH